MSRTKGPIHWSKTKWRVVNISVLAILLILILVSFLYPILFYKKWSESEWSIGENSTSLIINVSIPGTLYVTDSLNLGAPVPGADPGAADEGECRKLSLRRGDEVIEGRHFLMWERFELPKKGEYVLEAYPINWYTGNLESKVRFFGRFSSVSCCFSIFILPIILLVMIVTMSIISYKRKKAN